MPGFKFLRKRWVLIFTVLVMTVGLGIGITGCAAGDEDKSTILLADSQFESIWINNAIAEFIFEEGYDYPTESIQMTTVIWQVGLPKGDVDIVMELWQQNQIDWYNEEMAEGTIENLGMTYEGGPQFFIIPTWVHEQYDINTIKDMKEHWELFKDPEDSSKGYFLNCIIGWQCAAINDVKLEAYGLTDYYNIISPGSSGALEAGLSGPQMRENPVFGYYWAPTALMGMYDWYILEEPEYDEDIWNEIIVAKDDPSKRPLARAVAYETLPVDKGIWTGLRDKAPELIPVLEKMNVGLEAINKTAAWAKENEVQDWSLAAHYYLNNFESRWKTWVSNDAYKKIKAALDEL